MASNLVPAAARLTRSAPVFAQPEGSYDEFAARFPYEETEAQQTAIDTTLGDLAAGSSVNLEPCLKAGDALGGHLVSGHIDGVAEVVAISGDARSTRLKIAVPADLARYIARKGSVAVDGVSLTVNEVEGASFGVNIIPHTQTVTTLGKLDVGARVNLEVDQVARYVERLVAPR